MRVRRGTGPLAQAVGGADDESMPRRALPALMVALPLLLCGCGADGPPDVAEEEAPARPFRVAATPAPAGPAARGPGVETAWVVRRTWLRASPGGRVLAHVGRRTRFRGPRVVLVERRRGSWAAVRSEAAGRGGGLAWLPASALRPEQRVTWRIDIDVSARRLVLRRHGRAALRAPVAVGAPATPTPTGRFAVTDRLVFAPGGPYGCCLLAISGRQTRLAPGWPGGDRLAIHATSAPSSIGQARSNGCVRATEATMRRLLRRVPLGTPVVVQA